MSDRLEETLEAARACQLCAAALPHEPRPVVVADQRARILIIGQAPGRRVHESGIPWNDPSGDRLRTWLDVDRDTFYDPTKFAIVPMGFCFPGTGSGGDLPPRPECAPTWHEPILAELPDVQLTLLLSQYALKYYLKERASKTVTETVTRWREFAPVFLPLPHPSPRNQRWLRNNPWFETEVVPELKKRVHAILGDSAASRSGDR